MTALIELSAIQKVYESEGVKTPAIKSISLAIKEGEFVAVMGPSGSGKSTLLQILGLLDRASGGSYVFQGRRVEEFTDDELAKLRNETMGFIFQAFNLLGRASVLENVKLPLIYANVSEADQNTRATSAIESVGLSHRLNHEAGKLSGGEKQRVAIARALVNNPRVIFADEPTGNLDSKSGGQVMKIIKQLNNEGRTVILITHETYTSEFAERIIRLKDGELESDQKIGARRVDGNKFVK